MNKSAIAFATCLLAGLATAASAQAPAQTRPPGAPTPPAQTRPSADTTGKQADTSKQQVDDSTRPTWSPERDAVESGKLVGTKVQTADGKDIGSIDQLIVSHKDGKITHALLAKGGVLGIGATKLVMKWSDIKLQRDPDHEDRWLAVVDQAKLDAAPRYEVRKEGDTAPAASPATPPSPAPKTQKAPAKKY
jgi:sporulation protein YlmC with PRC-barrel domain